MNPKIFTCLIVGSFLGGFALRQVSPGTNAAPSETVCALKLTTTEFDTKQSADSEPPDQHWDAPNTNLLASVKVFEAKSEVEIPSGENTVEGIESTNGVLLTAWQAHFSDLLRQTGDREKAVGTLVGEIAQSYQQVVISEVENLKSTSESDRVDKLLALRDEIERGSGTLSRALELDPGESKTVIAAAVTAIEAEMQSRDLNLTHTQRVALFKLDEEKQTRLTQLLVETRFGTETDRRIHEEIDQWYENQMRGILGTESDAE